MNIHKISSLFLIFLLTFGALCGCNYNEDYVLYFELDETPNTLDPQLAENVCERIIVSNIFEGLTRKDKNGNTVNGVASSVKISTDELVYTFTISDTAFWSNGDSVTSNDFVMAFNRALNPVTKSPDAALLYCIKNAEEFNKGNTSLPLGIKAIDNSTLEITLSQKNPDFLNTLTLPVCMPCHTKTFGKSNGKYGLNSEDLLSNGSFKLRFWEKGETFSLRINKSTNYKGNFESQAAAVIFSKGDISERAAKIENTNVDLGFVSPSEAGNNTDMFKFCKTTYALIINKNSDVGNINFRKAFETSVHRNRLETELTGDLIATNSLIPPIVSINGNSLNSKINSSVTEYNPSLAHNFYLSGVRESGNPKAITILYYGNETIKNMTEILAESFQQTMGAVINIKSADSLQNLYNSIQNGDFSLAIAPISANSENAEDFLNLFTSSNNILGFKSKNYDTCVNSVTKFSGEEKIISASQKAVDIIANDHSIIPIANLYEAFGYYKKYTCPKISPFNNIIDLSQIHTVES